MHTTLIIGGGWSGIAAAMDQAQQGSRVVLVEERAYLGGRARSFTDRTTGDEIDNGQHVMMGCYHDFLHVLHTLGTAHLIDRQKALRVAFVDAHGKCDVLDVSRLPGRAGLAVGLLGLQHISMRSRLAAIRLAFNISVGRASGKGLSCSEFLSQHRQPADITTRFWEPIVLATLNADLNRAPATLLIEVMRLAFLGSRPDSQLLIPTVGLSQLLSPFPSWLEGNGGTALTSTSVDRIDIEDGSVKGAHLSNGMSIEVDRVISCIPQKALAWLLLASGIDAAMPDEPLASPIVSVYLWYNQQWMPFDFAAALGTTVQWVFDKRRIKAGLVALTVSAGFGIVTESTDQIIQLCDAELRRLFPEMAGAMLLHGQVIKEKSATPLFTADNVSQRISPRTPVAANLFIAGDWTDTGLPATLEGAVRSGLRASRASGDAVRD